MVFLWLYITYMLIQVQFKYRTGSSILTHVPFSFTSILPMIFYENVNVKCCSMIKLMLKYLVAKSVKVSVFN